MVIAHLLLKHPTTGKEVWVAVHTKKDAGQAGSRILREPTRRVGRMPEFG
jgi:predicted RNA binding protein YcfA (HicA-like mRNA interferase family)